MIWIMRSLGLHSDNIITTTTTIRVNNRCDNSTGSFEVKIGADTAKFTNVIITRLRERWYFVRESEMTVEDETKVLSWISGIEWAVVNFSELLLETDEQKCFLHSFGLLSCSLVWISWENYYYCTFFSFNVYPLDLILKSETFIFPALMKYQTSIDAVCNGQDNKAQVFECCWSINFRNKM